MKDFSKLCTKNLNITPTKDILDLLNKYYNFLVEYNKKVNLTRITDEKEAYYKHFYDSLLGFKNIKPKEGETLFDIGTGAGFPGVILAIFYPQLKVTLCESILKKVTFLKELTSLLHLTNVEIYHGRSEDYFKKHKKTFTYVTARAVSSIDNLFKYSKSLLNKDSLLILYKSANYEEELKDIKDKSFILKDTLIESLPFDYGNRVNLYFKKGK